VAEPESLRAHPLGRRCPRLGGPVTFRYCLASEASGPCFKVIDCWWETFDVVRFLQDHLPGPAFERLATARPMPKAACLAGLAERSKPPQG
jgi:hypothetical protein